MRLFISIEPPEEMRRALDKILPDHPDIRKTEAGQLHLTLLFIGKIQYSLVDELTAELGKIKFSAFPLKPAGVGAFPSVVNPRVIWAGLEVSEPLIRLQESVETATLRFLPDDGNGKPFHPHITLARVKEGSGVPELLRETAVPDLPEFAAEKFLLKQSELNQNGAIHQTVMEFPAS